MTAFKKRYIFFIKNTVCSAKLNLNSASLDEVSDGVLLIKVKIFTKLEKITTRAKSKFYCTHIKRKKKQDRDSFAKLQLINFRLYSYGKSSSKELRTILQSYIFNAIGTYFA